MPKNHRRDLEQWREALPPETFEVCFLGATEAPFTGRYNTCKEDGTYVCACCDEPLFRSETKYDSGSGWPSFWAPVAGDAVATRQDLSHGMVRTEALCAACDAHLGHVFPDGPPPSGLRYCLNSLALRLEPQSSTPAEVD
jgi:peptide-methionine (R)-S-oxide reductase